MPAVYEIHPDLSLVVTRYRGDVTDEEFIALYRRIFDDPAYVPGFAELADLREVEAFEFSSDAMRVVSQLLSDVCEGQVITTRTAMLTARPALYGIGRMYQSLAADTPECVELFEEPVAALEWLGIDADRLPQIA